jgi:hypothetical protein
MASRLTAAQALSSFVETFIPAIVPIVSSIVYYRSSPSHQPLAERLLASAHGVSIVVLYLGAMTVFWTGHSAFALAVPFELACLLPVALAIVSFFIFRGSKATHLLQLLNLVCLLWVLFIGGMAVTDDWL